MVDIETIKSSFKGDVKNETLHIEEIVLKYYLENGSYFFKSVLKNPQYEYKIKREIVRHLEIFQRDIVLVGSGQLGFSLAPTNNGSTISYTFKTFDLRTTRLKEGLTLESDFYSKNGVLLDAGSKILKGSILRDSKEVYDEFTEINAPLVVKKSNLKKGSFISPGSILELGSDLDFAIVSDNLFESVGNKVFEFIKHDSHRKNWHSYSDFCEYYFRGWIRPDLLPKGFYISRNLEEYLKVEALRLNIQSINIAIYRNWKFFFYYHEKNLKKIQTYLIAM